MTYNLPYMDASMLLKKDEANAITYWSERTHRGEPPPNSMPSIKPLVPRFTLSLALSSIG